MMSYQAGTAIDPGRKNVSHCRPGQKEARAEHWYQFGQ